MHPFDRAIHLQPTDRDTFVAHTSPDYANMIGPFGGATCAVLLQAVLQHPDKIGVPVAFTLNFAAPVADGAFTITARAVRTNRSTQHWVIQATQDSGVVALATAVMAVRRATWSATEAMAPQGMPAPSGLARMGAARRPVWVQRYDMRFMEGAFPQDFDEQEQAHSHSRLWVRDDPPRPLDYPALLAISDSFFPRIFIRRRRYAPMGTVSITTYFHTDEAGLAAQSEHYLMGTARANTFHQGFYDQSGELWSHDGLLLATTHQTVYFKD